MNINIHPATAPAEIWRGQLRERHLRDSFAVPGSIPDPFYAVMQHGSIDFEVLCARLAVLAKDMVRHPNAQPGTVVVLDDTHVGLTEDRGLTHDPLLLVTQEGNGRVYLECVRKSTGQDVWEAIQKLITPPSPEKRYLHYLVMGREGLELDCVEVPDWSDIVVENYPGADLASLEAMCTDKAPAGRLAVLHGPPGTGKTSLLRGLVARLGHKVKFVIVSPDLAATATGPEMLTLLVNERGTHPFVLIVEDADALLKKRATSDRQGFAGLSAILNASDGIVGSLCDIRVICTMNTEHAENNDIDAAALRVGRCAVNMFLGEFEPEQAAERVAALVKKSPKWLASIGITPAMLRKGAKSITLAVIYAVVHGVKARADYVPDGGGK